MEWLMEFPGIPRNGLMVKFLKQSKIVISYWKKFKRSRLHMDKESYNAARYKVHKMIFNKKKDYFENELNKFVGKPKELWKA